MLEVRTCHLGFGNTRLKYWCQYQTRVFRNSTAGHYDLWPHPCHQCRSCCGTVLISSCSLILTHKRQSFTEGSWQMKSLLVAHRRWGPFIFAVRCFFSHSSSRCSFNEVSHEEPYFLSKPAIVVQQSCLIAFFYFTVPAKMMTALMIAPEKRNVYRQAPPPSIARLEKHFNY